MLGSDPRRPEPLGAALERLTHGVTNLVRDHLELARLELREGARTLGQDAIAVAMGAVLVAVAHALLMVALALGLAHAMPGWLAFLLVGAANLAAGAALVVRRVRAIRARTQERPGPRGDPGRENRVLSA